MDVLVVGLGSMGKRRIRLLKKFDSVGTIVGVDSREDRRAEAVKLGCRTAESVDRALEENPGIGCAFISTSPLSHAALIRQALEHNLHVFTEINLVADGYEENMRLAGEKGRVLFLSSTFCYREEIGYLQKKLAGKSRLNYIYHVGQYLPDWHPWENYRDFFIGNRRTNGCREVMAIELPWITGTFGAVRKFHVLSDHMTDLNISYRDNYLIELQHENGNKGIFAVDVVSPKAVRKLEVYGEGLYYSWDGTPTSLEEFCSETGETRTVRFSQNDHEEGYRAFIIENAYENEIRAFFDAIQKKKTPRYGFAEDLKLLRLIDRIEEAAE